MFYYKINAQNQIQLELNKLVNDKFDLSIEYSKYIVYREWAALSLYSSCLFAIRKYNIDNYGLPDNKDNTSETFKEITCDYARILRKYNKENLVHPITHLFIYSIELINNSKCIHDSSKEIKKYIKMKYPEYTIDFMSFLDYPAHIFVFKSSIEYRRAKESGLIEQMRNDCYNITKTYDKINLLTEYNYNIEFYDVKDFKRGVLYKQLGFREEN